MKNKLLRYSLLMLLMVVGGISSVWATDYVPVTSTSQLVTGKKYLFVGKYKTNSMTAARWATVKDFNTSNYYNSVDVTTKEADNILGITISNPESVMTFTLGGESGAWTFLGSDNKYMNLKNTSNQVHQADEVTTDNQKWTIEIASETAIATIKNKSLTARMLWPNINNSRFACYGNTQASNTMYLFVEDDASDTRTETTVTLGDAPTTGVEGKTIALPTATVSVTDGDAISGATVTWSSTDETVAKIEGNNISLLKAGTTTIKASYAGDTQYKPSNASFTLTVEEAPVSIENPYTYTFTEKVFDAKSQTKKLNGVNWALITDGDYFNYEGTRGQQFGSGSKPATSLTLSTSDIPGTITQIKINTSGASSIVGTFGITVGETAFMCDNNESVSLTSAATEYTFAGSASGAITISYTQTSSKAIYIKSIEVTYTEEEIGKLFVIGDIAANGWDMTKMDELTYNTSTQSFELEVVTTGTVNFAFSRYQYESVNWDNFNSNDRMAIGDGNVAAVLGTEYELKTGYNAVSGNGPCVQIADAGRYKISVTKDMKMTITQLEDTYVVAGAVGDEAESGKDDILFGKTWDTTANELTADATGIYSRTFENTELTAGTVINYKIVKNGNTWIPDGMDNNLTCDIPEAGKYNITVTFDPTALTPNMTAEKTGEVSPSLASLKDLQENVETDSKTAKLTFTNVIVTAVKGNNAYLADANNEYGVLLYLSNHGLKAGDVINGTSLVDYKLYNGATEITSLNKDALTITTGEVTPVEKAINAITNANQSTVVTLKGVTYNATDGVFTDGTNTIKYFDSFGTNVSLIDGKKYDITGVVVLFNVLEISPRTATDVVTEMLYITGDFQGNWSTNAPAAMTYNAKANTFEYYLTVSETSAMHFAIATGTADNWDDFNNNYRLGIGAGDQDVAVNTEYQLAKYADGTMVLSDKGSYFVSVTEDLKMTITPVGLVTYQLQKDETFTSGQTVDVKIDEEVVATITYGETGGADFIAAKEDNHVSGYVAYTEGNGTNGNNPGGTFYTIVPKYDGSIEVAVALNSGKQFYILEDGTALEGYDGITVSAKYYGTYKFDVKAGKSYKFYCAGSKLAFYGFNYVYDITSPVVDDTYVVAGAYGEEATSEPGFFGTAWDKDAAANKMEEQADGTFKKAYTEITIADNTTIYYKVVKNGETWMPDNNLSYEVKKGGKFNITVTYDPTAQQDAIKMTVEALEAGDANLNGVVNTSDAVAVVSFALGKEVPTAEQFAAADINKNNVITVTDAVGVVNIALEMEDNPAAGAPMFDDGNNYLTLNGTALSLTNSTAFVAFQMDVTLTDGAMLNGVLPTSRVQGLTLSYNRVGENTWRIIGFSLDKTAISGNEGDLLTFDIMGNKTVTITNIEFADTYACAYALALGETTGINSISIDATDAEFYTIDGRQVNSLQKGLNIVKTTDGQVRKVVIK